MKMFLVTAGGVAGFIYGLLALVRVYFDVPFGLQAFILAGTIGVGASAGYLIGFMTRFGTRDEEES